MESLLEAGDLDGLFRQHSLADISRLLRSLELQTERSKQEVSQLVGRHYGRIIEAAESARQMQAVAERLRIHFQTIQQVPKVEPVPIKKQKAKPTILRVYDCSQAGKFAEANNLAGKSHAALVREEAEHFCLTYKGDHPRGLQEALLLLEWKWEDLLSKGVAAEPILQAMLECGVPMEGIIDRLWSATEPYALLRQLRGDALLYAHGKLGIEQEAWGRLRGLVMASSSPTDPLFTAGLPCPQVDDSQALLYAILARQPQEMPPVGEAHTWPLLP